jgi:molecular chaperone DnaK (HSP70)
LDRTRFTMQKVLRDAGLRWSDLKRVLLTGGSTRMPMVREMVEKESGKRIDRSVSVDEAVAHGAAVYAGMLLARGAGERPHVSVTNVNSHDLGVLGIEPETGRPRRKVLIPRNTTLPATHSSRFVTHAENQRTVAVRVIEGGDASGQNASPIGKCVVRNLPKHMPKGTTVVVNFTYGENGRLTVSATLPNVQNASATMTIERASGLTDDEVRQWQERIAQGLRIGAAPEEVPEVPEVSPVKPHEPPGEHGADGSFAVDADATVWEDNDTVDESSAPAEFLAKLSRQAEKSDRPQKQKQKEKPQEKKASPPPPPPSPKKKKTSKKADEEARSDEPPAVEEKKVDPDDDDALGNFLRGLK